MKVLIIYENIPESTDIYALEVSLKEWAWMQKCHGCYVNYDMTDGQAKACNKLSKYLESKQDCMVFGGEAPKGGPLPIAGFDFVIHTGFGM